MVIFEDGERLPTMRFKSVSDAKTQLDIFLRTTKARHYDITILRETTHVENGEEMFNDVSIDPCYHFTESGDQMIHDIPQRNLRDFLGA